MRDARYWIEKLQMQAHPEGGYYSETFRSADEVQTAGLPSRYRSSRSCSTAIYFLLERGQMSALHRLESDEVWHYYSGSALALHVIDPRGEARTCTLGPDADRGEVFQAVIPARHWFGAVPSGGEGLAADATEDFTLLGCTVAPGFCFEDFELGDRATLVARFPRHRALIERLTRRPDPCACRSRP
jgi:uncharacterized protein